MISGMLWYDNDQKKDINSKILTAVNYYKNKYGAEPNYCLLNSKTGSLQDINIENINIAISDSILIHHFLIGKDD